MSDESMSPAVRRALGLAPKVPKKTVNYDRNYDKAVEVQKKGELAGIVHTPGPLVDFSKKGQSGVSPAPGLPDSGIPVGRPTLKMTVFEELHRSLTKSGPAPISPERCPYPDDLCRGCPQAAAACGP